MRNRHKNIHLMMEFLQDPFLVLHFSYYALMTFHNNVITLVLSLILLSMLMILLSTLNLWQQLELASELESDLRDNVDWGRK